MSDGPSIRNRRITKACFHTCSTYRSRSQASLYPYALRMITDHAEEAIALLRYLLGGDRPSQTAHIALSPARIHGAGLEHQHLKGGISPLTP
jgi:hypothetical protein